MAFAGIPSYRPPNWENLLYILIYNTTVYDRHNSLMCSSQLGTVSPIQQGLARAIPSLF